MAALTWRDVAAPDFSGSLQGINQFSRLLGNAFEGASSAAGKFDSAQDEMANRAIVERSLAIRDPAAYEAALADGSLLGDDRFRASASTLSGLDSRVGALQNQALGKINLETTGRANDQSKAMDAAGAAAIEYQRLSGIDAKAAEAFRAAHPELNSPDLGYRNQLGIIKGADEFATSGLSRRSTEQRMDLDMRSEGRNQDLFNREKTEWGEGRAAQTLVADYFTNGGTMEDLPDMLINSGVSGPVAARIITMAGGVLPANLAVFGGASTAGGGSGGSGGAGGDPMTTMNYEARGGGFGSVPATVKTMGDASAYADRINSSGIASSAMGPFQIVGNTRDGTAKKLFGANWKSLPYSLENETKIATDIFNNNNGSAAALKKQWVSLSMSEAEQVRKMPPSQALAFIAQKESGATPEQLALGNPSARAAATDARTRAGTGQRISNIGGGSFDEARANAKSDLTSSAVDIATKLKEKLPGTDGWFTNTTVRDIADDIKQIRSDAIAEAKRRNPNTNYNMTFAEAGVIYENNTKSRWMPYFLGGKDVDRGGIDAAINRGIDGKDQSAVGALTLARTNATARDQSSAALAAARQNLTAARQRIRDPQLLAKYEQRYQQAAQADALNRGYEGNNNPIDSYGVDGAKAVEEAGLQRQRESAQQQLVSQATIALKAARAGERKPEGVPTNVWAAAVERASKQWGNGAPASVWAAALGDGPNRR